MGSPAHCHASAGHRETQIPSEGSSELGGSSFWVEDLVNRQELLTEGLVNTKSRGPSASQ